MQDESVQPAAALQAHFEAQVACNAEGLSRAKAIKERREDDKANRALDKACQDADSNHVSHASNATKSSVDAHAVDSRAVQGGILIDLELRKEQMNIRDRQIERLNWLIKKAHSKIPPDVAGAATWEQELEELYESPLPDRVIATPLANSFRSSVTSSPFSPISLMPRFKEAADAQLDALDSCHIPTPQRVIGAAPLSQQPAPFQFMRQVQQQNVLPVDFTSDVELGLDQQGMQFTADCDNEYFESDIVSVPASTFGLSSITPMPLQSFDAILAALPAAAADAPFETDLPPPTPPPPAFKKQARSPLVRPGKPAASADAPSEANVPPPTPPPPAVKRQARSPLVRPGKSIITSAAAGDSPTDCILSRFTVPPAAAALVVNETADEALARTYLQECTNTALHFQKQRQYIKYVLKSFRRVDVRRDGDCLFGSFVALFNRHGMTYHRDGDDTHQFTVKALRNFCADELIRTQGAIPGMWYEPFENGKCKDTLQRDGTYLEMNLAQYAHALRSTLYGGDLEICIFVWLFKMKVFVFNAHQWDGEGDKLCPAVHEFSSNPNQEHADLLEICLLWEQGVTGGADHYSLIIPTRKSTCEYRICDNDNSDDDHPPKALVLHCQNADLPPPPPPPHPVVAEQPRSPPPGKSAATADAPSEADLPPQTPPPPAVKKQARRSPLVRPGKSAATADAPSEADVPPPTPPAPAVKRQARSQLFRDDISDAYVPYASAPPSPDAEPPKFPRIYRHWHAVRSHSLLACVRVRVCVFQKLTNVFRQWKAFQQSSGFETSKGGNLEL